MATPYTPAVSNHVRSEPASVSKQVASAPFVCGTSALGNLYRILDPAEKLEICAAWFEHLAKPVVVDTAGRYGAGMALAEIGRCLGELGVASDEVIISNKLAWRRKPLVGEEPTFEPGIWKGMTHDAEQVISYDGILDCWREGCEALGDAYRPQLVSIHDPDEYLEAAVSSSDRQQRMDAILDAYRALHELKESGLVAMIGVGAKDWSVIQEIDSAFPLDWVMFATLLTIYRHPSDLVADVERMAQRGVTLINAGVFHSGFLVGGPYFDYRHVDTNDSDAQQLFDWRRRFHRVCNKYEVTPAEASVQFAISPPGISTVALNCDRATRVSENLAAINAAIPNEFWRDLKAEGVISTEFPYLG